MTKKANPSTDIKAASQLTIDGVKGIVDIVEAMYYTISRFGGVLGNSEQKRTTGITGFVFRMIRTILGLVGGGLDVLLNKLSLVIEGKESSAGREAVISALNGVLGDYLAKNKNPLAISMKFRKNGKSISADDQELTDLARKSSGKIVVMLHGSCMNDLQWNKNGHDHGEALANDFGYLPIYLYSKPFSCLGKIRSAGITDMRYSNLLDEDWKGRDRFELSGDPRTAVPLPSKIQCFTIGATMGKESSIIGDHIVGDGLVPLKSALGKHKKPEMNLIFPETHQWIGRNMNHLNLLDHPDVYKMIKNWVKI